jgi:hypothetical protein
MADSNLTKKLQIRQGITLLIINSPDEFKSQFSELKFDSEKSKKKSVLYDYLHIFVNNKSDLEKFFPAHFKLLKEDGLLWISYPKGTSGVKSDLNRDILWELLKKYDNVL